MGAIAGNDNVSVYVIDSEYRLVYFNHLLKESYPQVQENDYCYKRLCGESAPCVTCPLARENKDDPVFYNKQLKGWVHVETGKLIWPGRGNCRIILATPIGEGDDFYKELKEISTYEELNALISRKKEMRQNGDTDRYQDPLLDALTGLYRRRAFFQIAETFLDSAEGSYCLVAVDIEHFKLFNDWYGQSAGDKLLMDIGKRLQQLEQEGKGIAGYIGGDDFALLMIADPEEVGKLQAQITEYVKAYGDNAGFSPTFGVYEIEEREHSVSAMYDRAVIAMSSVKGNYAQRIGYYDRRMKQRMEEDHLLLSEVQRGMENGEFLFYAQPKCDLSTGRIVGLEALVRWNHPLRGIIAPGEYLPLLESNGLITNLDIYIWESVCKKVRSWIDRGIRPIPISVNVSCVDIFAIDVVKTFQGLIERYEIEPQLIEIEITESAYVERFEAVIRMVDELRSAGFTVLMDDFGSGYSSLNMLKDVNVDILKIDMKFLDLNENSLGRGVSILEAVVKMAHIMGMKIIAEGVETKEQVDFLLSMGCCYGQGYFFYQPLPVEEIERLITDGHMADYRGITLRQMNPLRMRDLLDENMVSSVMVGNILGAAAFYDVYGDSLKLIQTNEKYCTVTRTSRVNMEEHRKEILNEVHVEDREAFKNIFLRASRNQLKGAEGVVRRRADDGAYLWIKYRIFFLREQDGHQIYYGSLTDVSTHKQIEEQLESFRRALTSVVNISDTDQSFMKLTEENRRAAATIAAQMSPGGMIGGYCEPGFPLYFANYEMVRLMGYDTYEEFVEAIGGLVENTISPEDRGRVTQEIGPDFYPGKEYIASYRMPKKDGSWFWALDKGRVIRAEDGRLAIISACTDISETISLQRQMLEQDSRFLRSNEEFYYISKYMPGGYHSCANTPDLDFIYISERFLALFGYMRKEIQDRFDNKFINMVHPDDRQKVVSGVKELMKNDKMGNLEYRMLSSRGYIWVMDQSRYVEYEGRMFFQGIIMDVTNTVTLRNRMQMLIEYMPDSMVLYHRRNGDDSIQVITNGLFKGYGYSAEQCQQIVRDGTLSKYLHPEDAVRLYASLKRMAELETDYQDVLRFKLSEDGFVWTNFNARIVFRDQECITYLCVCSDITAIKQKEKELVMTSRKMESILRQAGINGWDWDFKRDTVSISGSAALFPAYSRRWIDSSGRRLVIKNFSQVFFEEKLISEEYQEELQEFLESVKACPPGKSIRCEMPINVGQDKQVWMMAACETLWDENGVPVKAVGYYQNISREHKQVLHLTQMAETDAMTGLFNRQAAIPRIESYIQNIGDGSAALIMFDLDNFKLANDVFGHSFGDSIIIHNAKKLKQYFRNDDVICRIGGDEFMILCKNIRERDLVRKLEKVIAAMTMNYEKGEQSIRFSASAGYVMIPEQGTEFDDLYGKTDVALFAAKMQGKNSFFKYSSDMKTVRYELAEKGDDGGI